jgi:hypothetical protein
MLEELAEGALEHGRLTRGPLVEAEAVRGRGSPGELGDPERLGLIAVLRHHVAGLSDSEADRADIRAVGVKGDDVEVALDSRE